MRCNINWWKVHVISIRQEHKTYFPMTNPENFPHELSAMDCQISFIGNHSEFRFIRPSASSSRQFVGERIYYESNRLSVLWNVTIQYVTFQVFFTFTFFRNGIKNLLVTQNIAQTKFCDVFASELWRPRHSRSHNFCGLFNFIGLFQ